MAATARQIGNGVEKRALSPLELALLNDFQRDFPLDPQPFARIAEALGVGEDEVLAVYRDLMERGLVKRVGPVVRPHRLGWSTLAAMSVPPERLAEVADLVTGYDEVNPARAALPSRLRVSDLMSAYLTDLDVRLLTVLQDGLPLAVRPYARVAAQLGIGEDEVLERLAVLQENGTLSRFGVVVSHRELGYRANAMVVWDVPGERADDCGRRLAGLPFVTLSYRRPRRLPAWPYNLFAMIHGKDRRQVLDEVEIATREAGLAGCDRAVLFSLRCFKQRGARYGSGARPARTLGEAAA
jgi:DNA-binding Lrp family transcriptional regulator